MSPVVETPLQTAWPAFAALAMLLLGLALSWRRLLPERRLALGLGGVLLVALVVRLWVIPAWARHAFDGHEAEYWDIFRGQRPLSRGGPVLYPSMQWLWWSLGQLLPRSPLVPVLVSTAFGLGSVATAGLVTARLSRSWVGGLVAAGVVALHPVHAAWSSSAYHVILPHFLGGLALVATGALVQPQRPLSRRELLSLGTLLAGSIGLAVATRIESAVVALPCGLLLLGHAGEHAPTLRQRLVLALPLAAGAALALLAARPILFPGELPGTGERQLAWSMHRTLLAYHAPFDTPPALGLVALGGLLAWRRWPLPTLSLVGLAVVNHLLMASFDDYGDRHTLMALWGLSWALGAGAVAVPGEAKRMGAALALGGLLVSASDLGLLHERYYGPEERFLETLDKGELAELPRYTLAQVPTVVAPQGRCGWIAEDHRVARDPPRSHFNLVDPAEAEALRGPDGCLRWCADVQDWRWSSRGVRDRAIRVHHLYDTRAVGVVEDPDSGFACVLWQIGPRRR